MTAPAILTIHDAVVTFGRKPLFDGLSFNIHEGNKICLVGRNGAGKTTLMRLITGERELDGGKRWTMPGLTIGYLQQEIYPDLKQTVFDYILSGLAEDKQGEEYHYMAEMMLEPFELQAEDKMGSLSGGQLRRAALAHALVEEPDILLLDEPTNHLDLTAIEWLEDYLKAYRGTLLCVSHDKTFLSNITNKIFWLDRGQVRVCGKGFAHFDEWVEMLLDQEARELTKREKLVAQEVAWATTGVKARRKRNVRRVEEMKKARDALKVDKGLFNQTMKKVSLEPLKPALASRVVLEFHKVSKRFEEKGRTKTILDNFNLKILRGDRIGILGKNGSGKTTFLKLLLGELKPDSGKVKLAHTAEVAYFDQKRADLNPKHSLWKTLCPEGGDYVEVGGKPRHVCGYLKNFLFDPKGARDLVETLSGGQRNRLMLAKVLANPGNFMILDEPTNDLDMDTLEMLEEILSHYKGTLFIVSHDRDFLDQTVTKMLSFEGDGEVNGHIGGYSDYLKVQTGDNVKQGKQSPAKSKTKTTKTKSAAKGLTFTQQHELDKLPKTLEALETEKAALHAIISDPDLYMNEPERFDATSEQIAEVQIQIEAAEQRWLELETLKEQA